MEQDTPFAPGGTSSSERRADPDDGGGYTLEALQEKYREQYTEDEILSYWEGLLRVPRDEELSIPSDLRSEATDKLQADLQLFNEKYSAEVTASSGQLCGLLGLELLAKAELAELLRFHCRANEAPSGQPGDPLPGLASPPLRFAREDRVVCNLGIYWAAGKVIDTDVVDPEDPTGPRLPYCVRLDASAGFKEPTCLAADDSDTIRREICFDARSELQFTKVAAPRLEGGEHSSLRFKRGVRVVCRVHDSDDGAAVWEAGEVVEEWSQLPPPHRLPYGRLTAEQVPYLVLLNNGQLLHAHWDHHTLIRREDLVPQGRCFGVAERFEVRRQPDGASVKFDHETMRGRTLAGDEGGSASE